MAFRHASAAGQHRAAFLRVSGLFGPETDGHRCRPRRASPAGRGTPRAICVAATELPRFGIQPTYCLVSEADACFCSESGLTNLALGTIVRVEDTSLELRVDRVAGDLPGLGVGDPLTLDGSGTVGEQVLLSRESSDGSALMSRVAARLVIRGDGARCLLNQETARRSVSVDTVFRALRAESSACVSLLATADSAWNHSQCSGSESQADGCGLSPGDSASMAGAGLTSVALLAALIRYRRARRR